MKAVVDLVLLALLLQSCCAQLSRRTTNDISKRQSADGYAPSTIACPSGALVRDSSTISNDEATYINKHRDATQQAWTDWLSSSQGPNLNAKGGISGGVAAYTKNASNLPNVAISLSGGGLRAMLNGIGYLQGLDSRNSTAVSRGTGGFLQLANYVAGLSGGSWSVGSLAINNWPTPQSLLDGTYDLADGLANEGNGSAFTTFQNAIGTDLASKQGAGYQISLIDYWGRLLSNQFVSSSTTSNTATLEWSGVQQTSSFTSATFPFPLITMLQSIPGRVAAAGNGSIWEVNPFEFGSWDKGIAAFSPTDIMGSSISNGASTSCVTGYDNFGFVVGMSSAIFNTLGITATTIGFLFEALPAAFSALTVDLLITVPSFANPFKQFSSASLVSSMDNVSFVDGGEDGQVIPMVPLLEPSRGIDLILAIDSGSDTSAMWPAGYSLFATYSRYANSSSEFGQIPMPKIPFVDTFINLGYNTRPTFFGCNSTTDVIYANSSTTLAPIIAYIPNYPWTFLSNSSGTAFSISNANSQSTVDNGFQSATMAGITTGSIIDWPTCLACASLQRSFERSGTAIPKNCQTCMSQYCWQGVVNNSVSDAKYEPSIGTPQWVLEGAKTKLSDGAMTTSSRQSLLLSLLFIVLSSSYMLL